MSLDVTLIKPPCSHCGRSEECVYSANITHNLGLMANHAGIYNALWRPNEHGFKHARDITEILRKGLADLKDRPYYYSDFDSPNGWGTYEHFVPFVEKYLGACEMWPDALIEVSR